MNPSDHVLLGDVALHVAVGVLILKELREGGVLGVSIQDHHTLVVTAQFGQSHPVRLPGSNLVKQTNLISIYSPNWDIQDELWTLSPGL